MRGCVTPKVRLQSSRTYTTSSGATGWVKKSCASTATIVLGRTKTSSSCGTWPGGACMVCIRVCRWISWSQDTRSFPPISASGCWRRGTRLQKFQRWQTLQLWYTAVRSRESTYRNSSGKSLASSTCPHTTGRTFWHPTSSHYQTSSPTSTSG